MTRATRPAAESLSDDRGRGTPAAIETITASGPGAGAYAAAASRHTWGFDRQQHGRGAAATALCPAGLRAGLLTRP